jgi:HD-GYP domain-containing protein (c-di-GMP phosphodiesterase class II)
MPLLLKCVDLQPGMCLHQSIMDGGRVLMSGGRELTHADVDILKRMYPLLTVKVGDPVLDAEVEFEDDGREHTVANACKQKVVGCMAQVEGRILKQASLDKVNFRAIHDSVNELIEFLANNPVSAALLARSLDSDSYIPEHAGNVFYLSMLLGNSLREYVMEERQRQTRARFLNHKVRIDLAPLGLGAMFMDIGMYALQHLYTSDEPLSEEDAAAIRAHPHRGAEMLPEDFPPAARMLVKTHHENYDGSGYPDSVSGDKLHVFTRILRIADAYDAATAHHVYKAAKSPARVIWEMTAGPYRRFYDPALTKMLARLIQPFPIGAKLSLADGRGAIVVRYNRVHPFYPTVIVAFDKDGKRLPREKLEGPFSLDQRADIKVHSFAGEDLYYVYEEMGDLQDADPPGEQFSTQFEAAYP